MQRSSILNISMSGGIEMTNKKWFQVGVAVLLTILIIKYFLSISFLFTPFVIIAKTIFFPLLLGGVLFYMTEPIQRFLEKRKVPRWGSILTILMGLGLMIYIFVAIIGPPVGEQVNAFVKNAPQYANELDDLKDYALEKREDLPDNVKTWIDEAVDSAQAFAVGFGKWIVQFLQSLFQAVFLLILVPFFFIFMLKDHEKFIPFVTQFFTGERKKWLEKTLRDINDVLKNYIQGQFLISAILALLIFIGYKLIGLEYALLLAIFALFMNLIPFIGPWIAVVPAIVIGYLQDPTLVFWVGLVTLIAQQTDSNLITPNVMGKTLSIHPLTVITLILAAGNIAGFLGILIAIPTYAVIRAIVKNIYEQRQAIKVAATKQI